MSDERDIVRDHLSAAPYHPPPEPPVPEDLDYGDDDDDLDLDDEYDEFRADVRGQVDEALEPIREYQQWRQENEAWHAERDARQQAEAEVENAEDRMVAREMMAAMAQEADVPNAPMDLVGATAQGKLDAFVTACLSEGLSPEEVERWMPHAAEVMVRETLEEYKLHSIQGARPPPGLTDGQEGAQRAGDGQPVALPHGGRAPVGGPRQDPGAAQDSAGRWHVPAEVVEAGRPSPGQLDHRHQAAAERARDQAAVDGRDFLGWFV